MHWLFFQPCINPPFGDCAMYFDHGVLDIGLDVAPCASEGFLIWPSKLVQPLTSTFHLRSSEVNKSNVKYCKTVGKMVHSVKSSIFSVFFLRKSHYTWKTAVAELLISINFTLKTSHSCLKIMVHYVFQVREKKNALAGKCCVLRC